MKRSVDAVFKGGVFRPLRKIRLTEGKKVKLSWIDAADEASHPVLALAGEVYRGLSANEIKEVESTALNRRGFSLGRARS